MRTSYRYQRGRTVLINVVFAIIITCGPGGAQSVKGLGALPEPTLPAFPGAEGSALQTQGGTDGNVLYGTNLNNSGAGTLRDEAAQIEYVDGDNLSTTYYVSPSGSGTACTNSNPCSLSQINLSPGTVLYLKSGTYLRSTTLNFSASGVSTARITISSAPGEHAIISGDLNGNNAVEETDGPRANGAHKWTPLVRLSGSYITFKDIEIAFSGGRGIQSGGRSNIISGSNVHHTWNNGIYIYGPDNIVEGNTVWRAAESNYCGGVGGSRACNGNWPGGLAWGATDGQGGWGLNVTIRNNLVYNISGEGILCMQTDGGLVEDNIVYDNWGLGIYLDQCSHTTIQKNLVYYTDDQGWWRFVSGARPAGGIMLSNEAINNFSVVNHDNDILNNVVIGAGDGIAFWRGYLSGSALINTTIEHNTIITNQGLNSKSIGIDYGPHVNTVIRNNIVNQTNGTPASGSGVTFSYNLWYPLNGITGPGDVLQDPKFVDASLGNYHLQPNSPACTGGEGGTYMGAYPCDATINTPTVTPVPPTATAVSTLSGLSWEAEQGQNSAPFSEVNGVVSQYVLTTNPADGGRAMYQFTIQDAGDYIVKAIVNAADAGSNSFFVGIDSEPNTSMIWDVILTNGFEERIVSWREDIAPDGSASPPKVFSLTPGEHTLIIRGREASTQLDKIEVAEASIIQPTNTAVPTATLLPTATPTVSASPTVAIAETSTPTPIIYTNTPLPTETPLPTYTAMPLDTTPPTVTNITHNNYIQFLITFSEDVGATGSNISNFSLIGTKGDQVVIDSISYENNSYTTTLNINGGNPLPPDEYTFSVVGSTSITDLAGNKLDGNADGIGGDDFVHTFSILVPTATPTESPVSIPSTPTETSIPPTATETPAPATSTPTPVSPTATITASPVPPSPTPTSNLAEKVYDDTNSSLIYSSGWTDERKRSAYGGSFKKTTQDGSFVMLNFTGQSFSILYKSGRKYRTMDVYVDNILVGSINQQNWKQSYQQRWDYPGLLAPSMHTLKLVFVAENKKNRTQGSFDAVIVR